MCTHAALLYISMLYFRDHSTKIKEASGPAQLKIIRENQETVYGMYSTISLKFAQARTPEGSGVKVFIFTFYWNVPFIGKDRKRKKKPVAVRAVERISIIPSLSLPSTISTVLCMYVENNKSSFSLYYNSSSLVNTAGRVVQNEQSFLC